MRRATSHHRVRGPRGVVLITAMWIAIALTAVVLVLCREMVVESLTARQHLAQAKADVAEIGVEQFIMSVVEWELVTPGYKDQILWEQREIGECYFWVIATDIYDETLPAYGLVDEASKIDINYATQAMLEYLPGFSADQSGVYIAASIVDWRDADDEVTVSEESGGEGAESSYYESNFGYSAKNSNFESVNELRLVAGLTDLETADYFLYGADTNHNGIIDPAESANADPGWAFENSMRGIMPVVTVHGYAATNIPDAILQTMTAPTTVDEITYQNPLDINNDANNLLSSLMQQYGLQANAQRPQNGYTSVWDWIVTNSLTSEQLSTETADGTPIFNLLTCRPIEGTTTTGTTGTAVQTKFAKLNVNTATIAALMCIPGFEQTDAENIVAYRDSNSINIIDYPLQMPNISWLLDVVDPAKLASADQTTPGAGAYLTGASTVFSADVVTVSHDGRAFKRVKIVVDASSGVPTIVYRRDLTDAGWPLDPSIRTSLRKGEPLQVSASGSGSLAPNRLTFGAQ